MSGTGLVLALGGLLADPSPSDGEEFTAVSVSPGLPGFIATFILAAAVVLLVIDMTRRTRRVQARARVEERMEAERVEAERESSEQATGSRSEEDGGAGGGHGAAGDAAADGEDPGDEGSWDASATDGESADGHRPGAGEAPDVEDERGPGPDDRR